MVMIVNKYAKFCAVCGAKVDVGQGFSRKEESGTWLTYCTAHKPAGSYMQAKAPAAPTKTITTPAPYVNPITQKRELTEDGRVIITPWTHDIVTLALIKSMPGRSYDPDTKVWTVSTDPKHRAEVIATARKLNLSIHPSWLEGVEARVDAARKRGLYTYQVSGVDWLNKQDRAILGDEMGLGKTVEAIMALEDKEAVIVVCPKNVKFNWQAEFKTWRPDYEVTVLNGRMSFRWPKPNECLILNYDILPDWLLPVGQEKSVTWKFEDMAAARNCVVICDEAHALKSNKTGRHKKVKALAYKVKKLWFLTGTPLVNKVNDLYGLLFALNRFSDTFGTMGNFMERFQVEQKVCKVCNGSKERHDRKGPCPYCKGKGGFGHDWNTARPDQFVPDILAKVMMRRTREQVLPDLPDVTYQTLVIDELSDKLRLTLDLVQEENEELLKLDKLPPFELFSAARFQLAKARIPAMLEFVEDCEEQDVPLVVFSAHRDPIEALKDRLGWETITGDVSAKRRQEIAEAFQRGELRGVGQTIQTAIGSNLSYAYTGLFVDLDWTPALNIQAERRLLRIGQKSSKINIVQMVSNHPLDIHLQQRLNDKMTVIRETVG